MQPVRSHLLLLLGLALLHKCAATCYFAPEVQGEFVMQSSVTMGQVQYSRVNITGESIPIWGICHKRIGNNVILMDDSGGGNCFRCFHLSLHSINVLQVRTEGLDKCYTSEDAAVHTCPGNARAPGTGPQEILLYKTKQITGEEISQEFCPISGRYTFTYNLHEGSEDKAECPDPMSELDNCPRGSELNLKFRRCSFENHDIKFQCLGHWTGPGRQKYLALLDTRSDGGRRAQYRCALYEEDARTGVIRMAFSSDSTCTSDLSSATRGFETMVLNPVPKLRWPYPVETSNCRFPRWAQGHWENLHVNGNQLTYRDQKTFHVSSVHCVGNNMGESGDKFGIYSRNQCGEDRYSCLTMKKRANNVVELKMSQISSDQFNETLCTESNFDQTGSSWQTQGRIDIMQESPCPITGEYLGTIPDIDGLCAKLYSDCNNPEIMFFTVFDCHMPTDVFEEREYRCLGQWEENGFTYTYTQRKDIGNSYECFVGLIVNKDEIFIKEAGSHCTRFKDITVHGMRLHKRGEAVTCLPRTTTAYPPKVPSLRPVNPTTSWYSSRQPPTPTKPWKPITAPPKETLSGVSRSTPGALVFALAVVALLSPALRRCLC